MQEKRYFTLEEANRCIPELVDEISLLRAIRAHSLGFMQNLRHSWRWFPQRWQ